MRDDIGVVLGTSIGGLSSQEKAAEDLFTRGYKFVDPMSIVKVISNAGACHIARHFGLMGPNLPHVRLEQTQMDFDKTILQT